MGYKAIFFDRDGTLLHPDPALERRKRELIEGWSGRAFTMDYEKYHATFRAAGYPEGGLGTVEAEKAFYHRFYAALLAGEGVTQDLPARAEALFALLWLRNVQLFPETREVLEFFRARGYRMGVISDTTPSLPLTLEAAGIAQYFDSFTCSDLAGAMKPDPAIYRAALRSLDVDAADSLYVDDYPPEADGARALGFTSFLIDRTAPPDGVWRINSLLQLTRFS